MDCRKQYICKNNDKPLIKVFRFDQRLYVISKSIESIDKKFCFYEKKQETKFLLLAFNMKVNAALYRQRTP